jgi:hypothetical protein
MQKIDRARGYDAMLIDTRGNVRSRQVSAAHVFIVIYMLKTIFYQSFYQ